MTSNFPKAFAQGGDPIKIGFLMDMTGPLQVYGKPKANCIQLAVDELNAKGGVLGRPVELVTYDTQSQTQLYGQYAQQLMLKDRVAAVFGAVTSASREVVRPVLNRGKTLYFYNTVYEGGVCDRNTFVVGSTPQQQLVEQIPYMIKRFGKKGYVVAADYNFGHLSNDWIRKIAGDAGGEILGSEFFPLEVNNFSAAIAKIQSLKPDWIHNIFVGPAHESFYGQWASAGMNKQIGMSSSTLQHASELQRLPPEVSEGIIAVGSYFDEIDTPEAADFRAKYAAKFGSKTVDSTIAPADYYAVLLWAEAVNKAGSPDRDPVIAALETGISASGPNGVVTIDAKSHHCTQNVYLGEVKGGKVAILEKWDAVSPTGADNRCDLIAEPKTNKQFGAMQ
ncbi:urea ABC transporter [Falsochrobactrum shanghaiense]|uniref:Urea ABC transporter n=2 Tax=Falsochrobactrum shanghaiense TaxID=2201899 RepID=A0A316J321_9HYPH|nr:urea ABC transporter [Falsochrobactrum shanghaiense]